jgi:hypothetical protein
MRYSVSSRPRLVLNRTYPTVDELAELTVPSLGALSDGGVLRHSGPPPSKFDWLPA